jgi:hypothetical protein
MLYCIFVKGLGLVREPKPLDGKFRAPKIRNRKPIYLFVVLLFAHV